ncbi:MAG: hypothetical protein SR1Q7_01310 [Quinella sp. 1Q7]|nr:hypothetical protein [Quinella sp. 1Q7]
MKDLPRFIKIGDDRINADEIVSYGFAVDEDDDTYLYVETRTSEDIFQYYAENVDFNLENKLAELDALFVI